MDSLKNPNSLKHKFTKGFLRTLKRIHKNQPKSSSSSSSSSPREVIWQRCRRVKMAADVSMASAVGSKRIWSQAILWKIRNRGRRRGEFNTRIRRAHAMKKRVLKKGKGHFGNLEQENKLRKLVPGGIVMDTCSLLDETAHYIKCLNTQVKVMRKIAEIY